MLIKPTRLDFTCHQKKERPPVRLKNNLNFQDHEINGNAISSRMFRRALDLVENAAYLAAYPSILTYKLIVFHNIYTIRRNQDFSIFILIKF